MGLWFEGSNALQTESVALLLAFARLVIHSTDPPRIEGIKQLLNRLGNVGSSRQFQFVQRSSVNPDSDFANDQTLAWLHIS